MHIPKILDYDPNFDMWDDSKFRHVGCHPLPIMSAVVEKWPNGRTGIIIGRQVYNEDRNPWYIVLWDDGQEGEIEGLFIGPSSLNL